MGSQIIHGCLLHKKGVKNFKTTNFYVEGDLDMKAKAGFVVKLWVKRAKNIGEMIEI